MDLLQNFYETTLDALRDAKNERLWFKTNTKVQSTAIEEMFVLTQAFFFSEGKTNESLTRIEPMPF